ncbi:hypothetical protein PPACK8108_LOCUS19845, partial [Phakopsora pachyrhizi]
DPSFPYSNGPGHCQASAQTLAIILQTMRKSGVVKFRSDLSQGFSTGNNQFLWNIALQTFINLVCLGEYTGISIDIYHKEDIWTALRNHVWLRLMRRYQEQILGFESQDAKAKAQRRRSCMTKLCLAQVKYILSKPLLYELLPVVENCCSDDETDDDAMDEENNSTQPTKRCTVLCLPWRSTFLEKLMVHINIL